MKAMIALCFMMSVLLSVSAAPATSQVSWTLQPTITAAPGRKVVGNTLTVCKGDSVRFFWGGYHGVAQTNSKNFKSCSLSKYKNLIAVSSGGDKSIVMKKAGVRYIYCQVPGHCSSGQKIRIITKKTAC